MVREISGTGGSQYNLQIKRVSVRSNGAGHANAGVVTARVTPSAPALQIKDTVAIRSAPSSPAKTER